jgi:hypothetical protein
MNESEFRDWSRAAMRDLDERIKRIEARPQPGARKVDARLAGDIAKLSELLVKAVRAGEVRSLAIAYMATDGRAMTGLSGGDDRFTLLGAVMTLTDELLHPEPAPEGPSEEKAA